MEVATNGTSEWHGISFGQLSEQDILKTKTDYYTHYISLLHVYMFLSVCNSFAKYLFFQLHILFSIQEFTQVEGRNKPLASQTIQIFIFIIQAM